MSPRHVPVKRSAISKSGSLKVGAGRPSKVSNTQSGRCAPTCRSVSPINAALPPRAQPHSTRSPATLFWTTYFTPRNSARNRALLHIVWERIFRYKPAKVEGEKRPQTVVTARIAVSATQIGSLKRYTISRSGWRTLLLVRIVPDHILLRALIWHLASSRRQIVQSSSLLYSTQIPTPQCIYPTEICLLPPVSHTYKAKNFFCCL